MLPTPKGHGNLVSSDAAWDASGTEIKTRVGTFFHEDLVMKIHVFLWPFFVFC